MGAKLFPLPYLAIFIKTFPIDLACLLSTFLCTNKKSYKFENSPKTILYFKTPSDFLGRVGETTKTELSAGVQP